MIKDQHGVIEYHESGEGATIVLVPGTCSAGAVWRPVMAEWKGAFRCITTSLPGYGDTSERRSLNDADIDHCAEVVEAVIAQAGCPVHLVGHSFGGTAVIAVALRQRVPLLSLTLAEATVPNLLRHHGEHAHYATFTDMSDAYIAAFNDGKQDAISQMMDFYGGPGSFTELPQQIRDYIISCTATNIIDVRCVTSFDMSPEIFARIDAPTLVFYGERSHPAVQRSNELLASDIPHARVAVVKDARHFMISTHPGETARLIADHVNRMQ